MLFLWILALLPFAFAEAPAPFELYHQWQIDLYTCQFRVTRLVVFCNPKVTRAYNCLCVNRQAMASLAGCLYDHSSDYEKASEFAMSYCSLYYKKNVTVTQFSEALSFYKSYAIPAADSANYTVDGVVTVPVYFDKATSKLYQSSYDRFLGNYDISAYFSFALMAYWVLVLLVYSVNNWMKLLLPSFFVRTKSSGWLNAAKKHVITPAAFGTNKQHVLGSSSRLGGVFQILMPSRLETFILLGFLGLCLAFMGVNMGYIEGDPVMKRKKYAMERYIADRTGIIATINIPLLILFGGRNNFLQWITGVDFATYITFHKWIGRMFIIMVIIHSVAFSLTFIPYYKVDISEEYVIWGVVGTCAGSLIFVQSLLFLRRKWYETFLVIHIVLAVIFIVGTWKHVVDLGYVYFLYVAIAIWSIDRFVRLCKNFVFGFPEVNMKLINGDLIKLEIPTNRWYRPRSGGFAFIQFLTKSKFMQSHPYSPLQLPNQINFYIKVKEGVTQTLQSELLSLPDMTKNLRVAVEGPYCGGLESYNVRNYHSAVFIAGGNGIPGMYSEALHLGKIEDLKQSVKLIWIVRDYNALNWFWDELLLSQGTKLDIEVFITRPETKLIGYVADLDDSEEDGSKKEKESCSEDEEGLDQQIQRIKNTFSFISFIHGRPAMDTIISSELNVAGTSVAFVACGHPKMVDEVRSQVSQTYIDKRVDFYEHLQVWA